MNVDVMRRIDHWAGVPLCCLLTLLRRPFPPRDAAATPKRILFIELSEMGSTILADPAMRKARQQFGAELFFVIFRRNAASLAFLRTVPADNVYTIRAELLFALAWDTLGFLRWSRRRQIDTVVDLELFSRFTALLSGLCGAVRRVGFYRFHNEGLYRGELLTHRVDLQSAYPHRQKLYRPGQRAGQPGGGDPLLENADRRCRDRRAAGRGGPAAGAADAGAHPPHLRRL